MTTPTNRSELRLAMAHAMLSVSPRLSADARSMALDGKTHSAIESRLLEADALLSALDAAGLVIVPREATLRMLGAAQTAWLADPQRLSSTIVRAAVSASPFERDRER